MINYFLTIIFFLKLKRLIKLKASGGLGNQLFQIAFSYSLLKKYPESILFIDKGWFKKNKIRDFLLDKLPISIYFRKMPKLTYREKGIFIIHNTILNFLKLYKYILKDISFFSKTNKKLYAFLSKLGLYTDDNRSFIKFGKTFSPVITISGYFQDINYVYDYQEELRNLILKTPKLKTENYLSSNIDKSIDKLSCLSRLGDDFIGNIDPELFLINSLNKIIESGQNLNCIMFSDNPKKLKKITKDIKNKIYIKTQDPLIQLYIASQAKFFILSNSSFAWWAYFLSEENNKLVFKPKNWFIDTHKCPNFRPEDKIFDIDC